MLIKKKRNEDDSQTNIEMKPWTKAKEKEDEKTNRNTTQISWNNSIVLGGNGFDVYIRIKSSWRTHINIYDGNVTVKKFHVFGKCAYNSDSFIFPSVQNTHHHHIGVILFLAQLFGKGYFDGISIKSMVGEKQWPEPAVIVTNGCCVWFALMTSSSSKSTKLLK